MEWKGNPKYLHEKKFFSILLPHLPHAYKFTGIQWFNGGNRPYFYYHLIVTYCHTLDMLKPA